MFTPARSRFFHYTNAQFKYSTRSFGTVLEGKTLAAQILHKVKVGVDYLKTSLHTVPYLAIVSVGDDPASQTYIDQKIRACKKVGIVPRQYKVQIEGAHDIDKITKAVNRIRVAAHVSGIMIQLPIKDIHGNVIPQAHYTAIDQLRINQQLYKDVDGLHPCSSALFNLTRDTGEGTSFINIPYHVPCTPAAVVQLLNYHKINIQKKRIVVVGRSTIVGSPIIANFIRDHYQVSIISPHYLDNLGTYTKDADVVIVAAGRPALLTKDMIKEGAVLIDIGINRVPDNSKKGYHILGDVDPACYPHSAAHTPVPGGVGPVTVAVLMQNTLKAALYAHQLDLPEELNFMENFD